MNETENQNMLAALRTALRTARRRTVWRVVRKYVLAQGIVVVVGGLVFDANAVALLYYAVLFCTGAWMGADDIMREMEGAAVHLAERYRLLEMRETALKEAAAELDGLLKEFEAVTRTRKESDQ